MEQQDLPVPPDLMQSRWQKMVLIALGGCEILLFNWVLGSSEFSKLATSYHFTYIILFISALKYLAIIAVIMEALQTAFSYFFPARPNPIIFSYLNRAMCLTLYAAMLVLVVALIAIVFPQFAHFLAH